MANFCSNCGKEILNDDKFCMNCGKSINEKENQIQIEQSKNNETITQIQQPDNNVVTQNNNQTKYTNGFGIAGFVISLVSLLICCGSFSWLSLIFSIIGLVNANKNNGEGKGLSIAGIIISAIVVVLVIAFIVLYVIGINTAIMNTSVIPD